MHDLKKLPGGSLFIFARLQNAAVVLGAARERARTE